MVKKIDHVFCAVPDAGQVDGLMELFCREWKLPAAWEAQHFRGFWQFYSGGVFLGNVIFEPVFFESATRVKPHGLSLQPNGLTKTLDQLQARGIPYYGPMPYLVQDAKDEIHHYWTNIVLDQFGENNISVFFCDFKPNPIFPHREIGQETSRLRQVLKARGGGPLGIVSVAEVVLKVASLGESRLRWQRILDPAPAESDTWRLGEGPALRLVAAGDSGLQSLNIKVDSRQSALKFLAARGLSHQIEAKGVRLKIEALGSLGIYLI